MREERPEQPTSFGGAGLKPTKRDQVEAYLRARPELTRKEVSDREIHRRLNEDGVVVSRTVVCRVRNLHWPRPEVPHYGEQFAKVEAALRADPVLARRSSKYVAETLGDVSERTVARVMDAMNIREIVYDKPGAGAVVRKRKWGGKAKKRDYVSVMNDNRRLATKLAKMASGEEWKAGMKLVIEELLSVRQLRALKEAGVVQAEQRGIDLSPEAFRWLRRAYGMDRTHGNRKKA